MTPDGDRLKKRVRVGTTGGKAERFATLPIATTPERVRKVGIFLGPDDGQPPLPDLSEGDRLLVSAEFQLTTDCEQAQSDCVKQPYRIEPLVVSQLLLSADPTATTPGGGRVLAITEPRTEKLTHAHHHHVVFYDYVPVPIPALPWSGKSYVCLVLSAHHAQAGRDNVLIAGQHEEGGKTKGDMATLSVVRLRGASPGDANREESKRRAVRSIPVVKGERRVVYTKKLEGLKQGEQLSVRVKLDASAEHLHGPARASLRVVLADRETDTVPGEHAKQVSVSRGEISRKNGTNRLPTEARGSSHKAGVLRIIKDAQGPLFVNTIIETGDPKQLARAGDELRFLDGGHLRIARYGPELDG